MENFIEDNKLKWHNLKKHDFKNLWNKIKNNQRGNIEVLYKNEEDWEEIDSQ